MLKIPYLVGGYEEDGIAIDDFIDQAAFQSTAKEFSGSMQEIEEYVQKKKRCLENRLETIRGHASKKGSMAFFYFIPESLWM
ncbi:MAG: hypothetical protein U5N58_07685 [Actinomycetota bacterium]|nr:hypothetical protein [Actinomycetota bacterium]